MMYIAPRTRAEDIGMEDMQTAQAWAQESLQHMRMDAAAQRAARALFSEDEKTWHPYWTH